MKIEDHLIKMKGGKLYCPVYVRIALFREKCPVYEGWGIHTECVDKDDQSALFVASIVDPQGRIVATGFKREHKSHFPDFEEKAGTGAVGRALLFAGFGTQYALDELDEGERIVDAPIPADRGYTLQAKATVENAEEVAQKAYKAAAMTFFKECQRLWGENITPPDAKSVYRKIYGNENMTTQNLMEATTNLSGFDDANEAAAELFTEGE